VARLAAENAIDLWQVEGTGKDGRITARDVERAIASRDDAAAGAAAPEPSPQPAPAPVPEPEQEQEQERERPLTAGAAAEMPLPTVGRIVELTPMRQAIAEHMVRSKHTAPHVTTIHEVDVSAVVSAREILKGQFSERGVRLTYTAFIVQAVAEALAEHPIVNSSWADTGIQVHQDINVGLAVALETGLIVPVIRNADQKSLMGLARDVVDLANRARNKKLVPDDVQGGTFTITNYGTLGSLLGTPVINQPQTAILGTGAIRKQVVVVEGPGGDTIAIRPMMYLSLTFDHRVLDGGLADPFVQTIVRKLETYEV
jgi:2-oxoglutarate dehydrogenase E2 component (dihydrolipoamide succinyltransferase)